MSGRVIGKRDAWTCTLCVAAITVIGCASKNARTERPSTEKTALQSERDQDSSQAPEQAPVANRSAPVREGDAGFVGPGQQESIAASNSATSTGGARPLATRPRTRDGRPEWWLAEPQRTDGRVSVCAEALGKDIREARRNAVEKGFALLRGETLHAISDEQVVYVTVRPLPIPAEAPGGARYAGYVMVSGLVEADE